MTAPAGPGRGGKSRMVGLPGTTSFRPAKPSRVLTGFDPPELLHAVLIASLLDQVASALALARRATEACHGITTRGSISSITMRTSWDR
jgi:hypothetical protein